MKKAVFLDKDGTLVDNSGYPKIIPSDEIYTESYEALKKVQEKGYKLFIISSQPWVARGRMTANEVKSIFESVKNKYAQRGIRIENYAYCQHDRQDNCPNKKPSTGLFENFIREHNIDTTKSYIVGDMDSDTLAGNWYTSKTKLYNKDYRRTGQSNWLKEKIYNTKPPIKIYEQNKCKENNFHHSISNLRS